MSVGQMPSDTANQPVRDCPGNPCGNDPGPVRDRLPCPVSYSCCLLSEEIPMGPPSLPSVDDWALERLRLPPEMIGATGHRRKPPRHRRGDSFIRGPIAYAWIASACRLPGSGLPVAMAYRFHTGRFRYRHGRRWDLSDVAAGLGIAPRSARRGLRAAEVAGLLSVSREPGCKLAVSVSELAEPEVGPGHRPLYGPIPWAWWLPASRLPGKSLQVASVCWLLAGWERSADFEVALDDWAAFGLSRFSASRGLDELERAGLLAAVRRPGRSPVVSILDPPAGLGSGGSGWVPVRSTILEIDGGLIREAAKRSAGLHT